MPESKKRVVDNKEKNEKHINVMEKGKGGRLLVAILAISMVAALLVAAVILVVQFLS